MARGTTKAIGFTIAALAAATAAGLLAAAPAEAGCTRRIANKSSFTVVVSRDGGSWVPIPPHRAQSIHYYHPGQIDVALLCGRHHGGALEGAVWRGSFSYSAILDRCYIEFGDGLFEDQLGPGFFGTADSKPLTLNMPRQGDVVVGPIVEERCAVMLRQTLRSRY